MWSWIFWQNVLERAIKSAAQFAIGTLVGDAASILTLSWPVLLGAAGSGALLSVLTSLGTEALPMGNPGTASLTKAVEPAPPAAESPTATEPPPLA